MPSPSLKWRIYYGDGSYFDSVQGTPWEAPRTNVQVIIQEDDRLGWEILSGNNEFYYGERGWYGANGFTFYDHLIRAKYPLIVFGRMLSNEEYAAIEKRVLDDMKSEGKPKTAWRRNG